MAKVVHKFPIFFNIKLEFHINHNQLNIDILRYSIIIQIGLSVNINLKSMKYPFIISNEL